MEKIAILWESFRDNPIPEVVLSKYGLKGQDCNSSLYDILSPGWNDKQQELNIEIHPPDRLKDNCDGRRNFILHFAKNVPAVEVDVMPLPEFMPVVLAYIELLFEDLHQRAAHPDMLTANVEHELGCMKNVLPTLQKYMEGSYYIGWADASLIPCLGISLSGFEGRSIKLSTLRKIPPDFTHYSHDGQWALRFPFKDHVLTQCFIATRLREAEPARLRIMWNGKDLVCFHLDNIPSKEAIGKFAKLIEHKPEERK